LREAQAEIHRLRDEVNRMKGCDNLNFGWSRLLRFILYRGNLVEREGTAIQQQW